MPPSLERLAELGQHARLEGDPRLPETEHESIGHLDRLADRAHRLDPPDQLFEEDPDLESGEAGTEAEVRADAKGEVVVRPARDIEAFRVDEVRGVAVGRTVEQDNLLAGT